MTPQDLDALEKLADEALLPMPDRRRRSWFNRQRQFADAANPATIKALIAELRTARVLLSNIHERATEGHKKAGCDNWRAVDRCRQIANLTSRNGKGEGG